MMQPCALTCGEVSTLKRFIPPNTIVVGSTDARGVGDCTTDAASTLTKCAAEATEIFASYDTTQPLLGTC